jgi:hypothetical protein
MVASMDLCKDSQHDARSRGRSLIFLRNEGFRGLDQKSIYYRGPDCMKFML